MTSSPRHTRLSGLERSSSRPNCCSSTSASARTSRVRRNSRKLIKDRPLRRSRRGRPPAGRERRADHRRQHGRGPDRLRDGDGEVPEPDRVGTGHRARARDGRLVEVERDRVGLRCLQGKGVVNSISLKEGENSSSNTRAGAQLRRSRRRDGVRRDGPGGHEGAQGRYLHPRLQAPDRGSRLSARGHHLRSEHFRDRDRHRGTQQLRGRLHRGDARHQGNAAALPYLGRRLERLVLVPRQRDRAPGDPFGVPVSCDQGRHGHGHRQCGRDADLRRPRFRTAGARRGRRAQPPRRRHGASARNCGTLQGQEG